MARQKSFSWASVGGYAAYKAGKKEGKTVAQMQAEAKGAPPKTTKEISLSITQRAYQKFGRIDARALKWIQEQEQARGIAPGQQRVKTYRTPSGQTVLYTGTPPPGYRELTPEQARREAETGFKVGYRGLETGLAGTGISAARVYVSGLRGEPLPTIRREPEPTIRREPEPTIRREPEPIRTGFEPLGIAPPAIMPTKEEALYKRYRAIGERKIPVVTPIAERVVEIGKKIKDITILPPLKEIEEYKIAAEERGLRKWEREHLPEWFVGKKLTKEELEKGVVSGLRAGLYKQIRKPAKPIAIGAAFVAMPFALPAVSKAVGVAKIAKLFPTITKYIKPAVRYGLPAAYGVGAIVRVKKVPTRFEKAKVAGEIIFGEVAPALIGAKIGAKLYIGAKLRTAYKTRLKEAIAKLPPTERAKALEYIRRVEAMPKVVAEPTLKGVERLPAAARKPVLEYIRKYGLIIGGGAAELRRTADIDIHSMIGKPRVYAKGLVDVIRKVGIKRVSIAPRAAEVTIVGKKVIEIHPVGKMLIPSIKEVTHPLIPWETQIIRTPKGTLITRIGLLGKRKIAGAYVYLRKLDIPKLEKMFAGVERVALAQAKRVAKKHIFFRKTELKEVSKLAKGLKTRGAFPLFGKRGELLWGKITTGKPAVIGGVISYPKYPTYKAPSLIYPTYPRYPKYPTYPAYPVYKTPTPVPKPYPKYKAPYKAPPIIKPPVVYPLYIPPKPPAYPPPYLPYIPPKPPAYPPPYPPYKPLPVIPPMYPPSVYPPFYPPYVPTRIIPPLLPPLIKFPIKYGKIKKYKLKKLKRPSKYQPSLVGVVKKRKKIARRFLTGWEVRGIPKVMEKIKFKYGRTKKYKV